MSFFFAQVKKEGRPPTKPSYARRELPTELLQRMGCNACPRHSCERDLEHPKHEATGGGNAPDVFVLWGAMTERDDHVGSYGSDKAGGAVLGAFSTHWRKHVRQGALVQCWHPKDDAPTPAELECCRPRVIADIERAKPLVVVSVGDEPLRWSTGLAGGALPWRARLLPARFGAHACWVFPIAYPNFVHKESKFGPNEWEVAQRHDIKSLEAMLDAGLPPVPEFVTSGFDDGYQIITGDEPRALVLLENALADLVGVRVGLDIETNGLSPFRVENPRLLSAAVGTRKQGVAFALSHREGWATDHQRMRAHGLFGEFIMASGRKVAHNLAMEQLWLGYVYGERVWRGTEWEDSLIAADALGARNGTKSLDAQVRQAFGFNLKALSNLDAGRLDEYPVARVLRYNGMDAKWTAALFDVQEPALNKDKKARAEYERKLKLCPTLVSTECLGVPVDLDYAKRIGADLGAKAEDVRKRITTMPEVRRFEQRLRYTFDPGNPGHVLTLLRDICQRDEVKIQERDGSVRQSSDEAVLSSLPEDEVPSAPLILELRASEKLLGTYITPLIEGTMAGNDGKLHPHYSSTFTTTGRLNAENPNIQNFPKRKHKEVRGTVVAGPGRLMMPCDYGQIEFRVAGMCSEDDNLVRYCWTGYDVHKAWAEVLVKLYPPIKDWIVREFGVDWDEKGLKTLRQEAKNKWVFPSIFGASVKSRANSLHLPPDVSKKADGMFWDEFKGVKAWQNRLVRNYEEKLYVETLAGRKRYGPLTLNEIINTPIQGTAADIVTEAMTALSEDAHVLDWPEIHPGINVHDDLTFFPFEDAYQPVLDHVARAMCAHRFPWVITPLVVEASLGYRWHECKEIAVFRSDELFQLRNPYDDTRNTRQAHDSARRS